MTNKESPKSPTIELPGIIIEALNTWQLFRRFGYPAESIFLELPTRDDDKIDIIVSVHHMEKVAPVRIGSVKVVEGGHEDAKKVMLQLWKDASVKYKALTNEERMEIFNESHARRNAVTIMGGFLALGLGATPEQIKEREMPQ